MSLLPQIKNYTAFLAIAVALLVVRSVSAAPILDQANPTNGLEAGFNGNYNWQQGVTAGVSGQLVGIELFLQGTSAVLFGINSGAPWQSDADDFVVNDPTNVYGWNYFDLTAGNISLVAGQMFTINLLSLPSGFAGTGHDGYAAGALFIAPGVEFQSSGFVFDAAFRTFVEPASAVPEAGITVGLLTLALLVFAIVRARFVHNGECRVF